MGLLIFFLGRQLFISMNLLFPNFQEEPYINCSSSHLYYYSAFGWQETSQRFIISLFFSMLLFIYIFYKMVLNFLILSVWARWARLLNHFGYINKLPRPDTGCSCNLCKECAVLDISLFGVLIVIPCENADISVATGVAEGTIRNSYKDLYPHVSKIIPSWYAKEEDLKNLCSPWM